MVERDVGEMGEKVLEQWAAEVGIIANKARRDRSGWDFILELPDETTLHVVGARPLDRAPHPIQCFVQVKATDQQHARWRVKMDNWRRLVTTPLPAFLLVLEFDGTSAARRAHLVHVGESLIRTVLLELRRTSVERPAKPLHRRKLPFKCDASDAITPLNGHGLLQALRRRVQPNVAVYIAEKQRLVRELGYETGGEVIQATTTFSVVPGSTPDERLVRFALGIEPELPIKSGATVWDERFGIRHPEPVRTILTPGKLVSQPLGDGEVRLRAPQGAAVTLPVRVFSSGAVRALVTDRRLHVRLVARYAEFLTSIDDPHTSSASSTWTIKLNAPDPAGPQPLEDLLDLAALLQVLCACGAGSPGTFEFRVEAGGEQLRLGPWPVTMPPPDTEYEDLAHTIVDAWVVLQRFGVPSTVGVSINDLWKQRETITRMLAVLRNEPQGAHIEFEAEDETFDTTRLACVPLYWYLALADHHLMLTFAALGSAIPASADAAAGYRHGLTVTAFDGQELAMYDGVVDPSTVLPDLLERVAQRCEPTYSVCRWWLRDPLSS